MRRHTLVAIFAGVALLAVGCSSGKGDDGAADGGAGDGGPTSTDAAAPSPVQAVSQNILHGIFCAEETSRCRLPERIALFFDQLEAAGCPDLVSLQEANSEMVPLIEKETAKRCNGAYEVVHDGDRTVDREIVLTTRDVLGSRRVDLAGPLRTALWVRVASDVGVVEFVTTHLASSSDDAPCTTDSCPPPCSDADTLNSCQARQIVDFVDTVRVPADVVIFGGDLNAEVDEPTIRSIVDAGYVDTHLAAGNAECDPVTGEECTSGRADDDLSDLTDPASRQTERIDYLFLLTDRDCRTVEPLTGLFNAEANTAEGALVAFPSDHTGVIATIECATTPAQVAAATEATVVTTTTTPPANAALDDATRAAITETFETLFNGTVTDSERKLAAVEDAEILREAFMAQLEAVKEIASLVSVRIDDMRRTAPDRVAVTYSIILDGTPVLDHVAGEAVMIDGEWLVSRRTYCEVATQGATEIPEACL